MKKITNVFVFNSKIKWPTITIFWWIHWDEISWVKVIDYLKDSLNNWDINLLKWRIILAYGNEEAIKKWFRQIKYNLNRIFLKDFFNKESNDYEINRMKDLKKILDNSDVLLDIHSTSSNSEPFMFSEDFKNELSIWKVIWTDKIITWWEKNWWDVLSWDTNLYMHSIKKIAFTLECWQHRASNAFNIWLKISLNLMKYFNLIEWNIENNNNHLIEMYKVKITNTWQFLFKEWIDNFKEIKKWDFIWYDWEEKILAEEDFIILLPKYWKAKIWEEIFFYWKKIIL